MPSLIGLVPSDAAAEPTSRLTTAPRSRMSHFHCPECQDDTLEEVSKAISYTMIAGFYDDYEDYWDREIEETEVIRIQCYNCGFTVCEGKPQNLHAFLVQKGWIQGGGAPVPATQGDWEV